MAHNKRYSMLNKHFEDKGSSINRTEPDVPVIGHKLDVSALVEQNVARIREQSTPPQKGTQPPGAATS